MKKALCTLLLSGVIGIALHADDFKVVFETTGCNGESGFATAKADAVYKIEDAGCSVPGENGKPLKRILVRNDRGSFDTFTLTPEEAKNVIADVKTYMKARLKNLENANTLKITK